MLPRNTEVSSIHHFACGYPENNRESRAAYLVLKDAIRLLILLEILTSSGDVGSKYWSRMRTKVLNCSSEPLGTWYWRETKRCTIERGPRPQEATNNRQKTVARATGASMRVVCSLGIRSSPPHAQKSHKCLFFPVHMFSRGVARFPRARSLPMVERQASSLLGGMCFCDRGKIQGRH